MILVSIVVAEELVKDGLVTQNLWIRPVFVDLEVDVLVGAFKIGVHPTVLRGPGQHCWCQWKWVEKEMKWWLWYLCDASGILHRAFVAYFLTHLLKTQSANMKNSNTCKAFPALRAIGSNRYSPNCRNPWYIQYKPDLDEKKSVFITAQLEVQGKNMIWFTDCKFILKYFLSPISGTPSSKLSSCLCALDKHSQKQEVTKNLVW